MLYSKSNYIQLQSQYADEKIAEIRKDTVENFLYNLVSRHVEFAEFYFYFNFCSFIHPSSQKWH